MFHFDYLTTGTCSQLISIDLEGDIIRNVVFTGGCNGNTQGVAALVKGMNINDVISKLSGIPCGTRPTSCPDQLSIALKSYIKENSVQSYS